MERARLVARSHRVTRTAPTSATRRCRSAARLRGSARDRARLGAAGLRLRGVEQPRVQTGLVTANEHGWIVKASAVAIALKSELSAAGARVAGSWPSDAGGAGSAPITPPRQEETASVAAALPEPMLVPEPEPAESKSAELEPVALGLGRQDATRSCSPLAQRTQARSPSTSALASPKAPRRPSRLAGHRSPLCLTPPDWPAQLGGPCLIPLPST